MKQHISTEGASLVGLAFLCAGIAYGFNLWVGMIVFCIAVIVALIFRR